MQSKLQDRLPYLVIVILIILADRISKSAVRSHFGLGQPVSIIDGAFNITYLQNTGVAFGILDLFSSPLKALFLCLIAAAAAVIVILYSFRNSASNRLLQGALG